jgi:cell envelope opacity-associated protein A
MTAEQLKEFAEIKEAITRDYSFTADNWRGRQVRNPRHDEHWLVAHLEVEARHAAWAMRVVVSARGRLKLCRVLLEKAERRAQEAEVRVQELAKLAKTAAARLIAEWATKNVIGIEQPSLAETVMAAIDAALRAGEPLKEDGRGD